jgi:hypothetical protein
VDFSPNWDFPDIYIFVSNYGIIFFSLAMSGGGAARHFCELMGLKRRVRTALRRVELTKLTSFYRKAFLLPPGTISLHLTFNNFLWMHDERDR